MAIATDNPKLTCPTCSDELVVTDSLAASCINCGWSGKAFLFQPLDAKVEFAQDALPDDATCVHHPRKRATATCSGSGDYVCALCCIEIEGKPYSAQYLDTAGKDAIGEAFDRFLPRPDRTVARFLLLCFAFPLNVYWLMGAPIWIPIGYFGLMKASRLRHQNVMYHEAVSKRKLVFLGVVLTVFTAVAALVLVSITAAIINNFNH